MSRRARVTRIKVEVKAGIYRIDPAAVAEAMLRFYDEDRTCNLTPEGRAAQAAGSKRGLAMARKRRLLKSRPDR